MKSRLVRRKSSFFWTETLWQLKVDHMSFWPYVSVYINLLLILSFGESVVETWNNLTLRTQSPTGCVMLEEILTRS